MVFFRGIRNKFIAIYLLFGLIPLLVISYLSFQSASASLERHSTRQLSNLAHKTASQARQRYREVLKDIDLLAGFPFIQLAFLQFSFGQRLETVSLKLKRYQSQNDFYSRISLISPNGDLILTVPTPEGHGDLEGGEGRLLRTANLTSDSISGVIENHSEGPVMVFSRPVYDFENPLEAVGLLAFYIRLESLTRFVDELDEKSDAIGFIFDHGQDRFLQQRRLPFDPSPLLPAVPGEELVVAEREGHRLFLAGIPELNWTVGLTLPESMLFGDIERLRQHNLSFALTIAVLALLTTLFFVRRITDPIRRLIRGAQEFSEGNLDHRIEIQGEGEMRRVGEEFNAMAQKLEAREKQMRTVDRLASLGILAAGVAHEVRNPLAGMKSCAQLMQRKAISGEVSLLAAGINEEILRLDDIVRQLLEFARPGGAARAPVDLARVVERALEMTQNVLEKEGISILREISPVPAVFVDAGQVQQILLNLILNAAQAMEGGGRLRLALKERDEDVVVTVADTGCGIEPEHQARIFDPFFTLRPAGTGLGLSVAHSLMEENGIQWQIESQPGEGTSFRLIFSVAAPEGE
ncbi:MAG: ATP-binding protein [Geoalkalibacter sp.]|uniref:sensor histidine kinase n=1 Tax=Geoalkalibacter sp. TaxID=3041440 RepID=UPI003D14677B